MNLIVLGALVAVAWLVWDTRAMLKEAMKQDDETPKE